MTKKLFPLFLILSLALLEACSTRSSGTRRQSGIQPCEKASLANSTAPSPLTGKVIKITDGDTIKVLNGDQLPCYDIRLKGIDSPEKSQAFFKDSSDNLSKLLTDATVTVEWTKIDQWGRLVGKVFLNGQDVCLEQVNAGLAWHFKRYENEQNEQDRAHYSEAENEARSKKIGLWQDQNPIPPWKVRHPDSDEDLNANSTSDTGKQNHPTKLFSDPQASSSTETPHLVGLIRGNKNSMIYHWPGCPDYDKIALHNRVPFKTGEEAQRAGYRAARNCR